MRQFLIPSLLLSVYALTLSGCIKRHWVTSERVLQEPVTRARDPIYQLEARPADDSAAVDVLASIATPIDVYDQVERTSEHRLKSGAPVAALWGGIAGLTALVGVAAYVKEGSQQVETMRRFDAESNEGLPTVETRQVIPQRRAGSTGLFVAAGGFGVVAGLSFAAPALPPSQRRREVDLRNPRREWEESGPATGLSLELRLGGHIVAEGRTDGTGESRLVVEPHRVMDWGWRAVVAAPGTDGKTQVDLRDSEAFGAIGGSYAARRAREGDSEWARASLGELGRSDAAFESAWAAYCGDLAGKVDARVGARATRSLAPPDDTGQRCVALTREIEVVASKRVRSAVAASDVDDARDWLDLVGGADRQGLTKLIEDIESRLVEQELARLQAEQRRCDSARTRIRKAMPKLTSTNFADAVIRGVVEVRDRLVRTMETMVRVSPDGVADEDQDWVQCVGRALESGDDMARGIYQMNHQGYAHEWVEQGRFDGPQEGILGGFGRPGEVCHDWVRKHLGSRVVITIDAYLDALDDLEADACRN